MLNKFRKSNEKGFTLIELLIVVAIIGILAAIAIPQFAAYRIKGFNSAALSDLKNIATSESGFFADWQSFGTTVANVAIATPMVYAGANGGPGALVTGPPALAANTHTIQANVAAVARGVNISLSTGVSMEIASDVIAVPANPRSTSFLITSKHLNGNTYYAQDSDTTALYQDFLDGSNGAILAVGDAGAASTQGVDNLAATAAPSGAVWVVK